MKRYFKHLLSLSAMLAFAFTASPADAQPGKKGKGFKGHGKNVQVSNAPHSGHGNNAFGKKGHIAYGKKGHNAYGKKGHFDGRRRHYVKNAPPVRRRARMRRHRRAGYTWIPGKWSFCQHMGRYTWVDGYWTRTRQHRRWVQGRWASSVNGWHFVSGYWM